MKFCLAFWLPAVFSTLVLSALILPAMASLAFAGAARDAEAAPVEADKREPLAEHRLFRSGQSHIIGSGRRDLDKEPSWGWTLNWIDGRAWELPGACSIRSRLNDDIIVMFDLYADGRLFLRLVSQSEWRSPFLAPRTYVGSTERVRTLAGRIPELSPYSDFAAVELTLPWGAGSQVRGRLVPQPRRCSRIIAATSSGSSMTSLRGSFARRGPATGPSSILASSSSEGPVLAVVRGSVLGVARQWSRPR
jgi:hypothetical protein